MLVDGGLYEKGCFFGVDVEEVVVGDSGMIVWEEDLGWDCFDDGFVNVVVV